MSEPKETALEVENISKQFFIQNADSGNKEIFNALSGISFSVHKGDAVGIIGNNGSGKSTLLKILSRITKPSGGEARFYGTVTSILDIGNNFHPDLTGRENAKVHLKLAQIPADEFDAYYDKIKSFSEIEDFFDQPVKYYSSGMFLRLAFSLAFHLASDILILDEVLSVGDEGFRLKCYELLKQLTKHGRTILFVSHNRSEILELSNKCIWLDKGQIKKSGIPSEVLGEYFAMHRDNYDGQKTIVDIHAPHTESDGTLHLTWNEADAPANDVLAIREVSVRSPSGEKLISSEPIEIKFLLHKKKAGTQIGAFFFLEDIFYQPVMVGHFLNNSKEENFGNELKNETGLIEISCVIPANFLIPGQYFFLVRFGMEENEWSTTSAEAFRFSEKMSFTVHPQPNYVDVVGDISKGSVRPLLDWSIQKVK